MKGWLVLHCQQFGDEQGAERTELAKELDKSRSQLTKKDTEELDKLLDDKPGITFHVWMFARRGNFSKMAKGRSQPSSEKTHWHGTQVRMSVIPKYRIEAYLVDLLPGTVTVWPEIVACDPTTTREYFYMAHAIDGSTTLPVAAHEKALRGDVAHQVHSMWATLA